jgi:ferredoxin-NADP reductase
MVDIEGPTYKSVLLVAGGIGITPMISTFTSLLDQYARGRPLNQVYALAVLLICFPQLPPYG